MTGSLNLMLTPTAEQLNDIVRLLRRICCGVAGVSEGSPTKEWVSFEEFRWDDVIFELKDIARRVAPEAEQK